ncbi:hypothetical protein HMI55_007080 [Coelomomyces lativittatus]|nr:hypothetical protein HMI56_000029 [Coelomomyces lativittatus]KAJ1510215.1 hypothetical protein HMI55_007080 [Coelomomyces lativittatus]
MTTAARPTFHPAKGGHTGRDLNFPTLIQSSKQLPSHTKLKLRKKGQDSWVDIQERNLKAELEQAEREYRRKSSTRLNSNSWIDFPETSPATLTSPLSSLSPSPTITSNSTSTSTSTTTTKFKEDVLDPGGGLTKRKEKNKGEINRLVNISSPYDEDGIMHSPSLRESEKKSLDDVTMGEESVNDSEEEEDEDEEEESDEEEDENDDEDDSEVEDDEDEETAMLLRELEKIKKERAEEKEKLEKLHQEQQEQQFQASLLTSNPLLATNSDLRIKRRWDEDVVFKNQARIESKPVKRFINDTIRSDFHRKFLSKYIK